MKRKFETAIIIMAMTIAVNANAQKIPVWKLSDLKTVIDTSQSPTIINFWATFCKPCLGELPHFQQLANQYKQQGVKLILVSLDLKEAFPKAIGKIVNAKKLTSPVVFLDETDADLFVPAVDKNWSGVIPASLFINKAKGYRNFVEDELNKDKLEVEIKKMLE